MIIHIGDRVEIGESAEKFGDAEFVGEIGTYVGINERGFAKVKLDNEKLLMPVLKGVTRVHPECLKECK